MFRRPVHDLLPTRGEAVQVKVRNGSENAARKGAEREYGDDCEAGDSDPGEKTANGREGERTYRVFIHVNSVYLRSTFTNRGFPPISLLALQSSSNSSSFYSLSAKAF